MAAFTAEEVRDGGLEDWQGGSVEREGSGVKSLGSGVYWCLQLPTAFAWQVCSQCMSKR